MLKAGKFILSLTLPFSIHPKYNQTEKLQVAFISEWFFLVKIPIVFLPTEAYEINDGDDLASDDEGTAYITYCIYTYQLKKVFCFASSKYIINFSQIKFLCQAEVT